MEESKKSKVSAGNYHINWDQYYQRTYRMMKKKALWDVPPEAAVAADFLLFKNLFDKSIPVVDLGCGTGTQSFFLSNYFAKVLGVDVSKEAISVAKETYSQHTHLEFDVMDGTDTEKARQIHQHLGDANIYMRGVLHQIMDQDIPDFQESLKIILGEKGVLYGIEVSDRIRAYFNESKGDFSKLPQRMQQVFISNLPPRGLSLENLTNYFPDSDFEILKSGISQLNTNIRFAESEPIYIPAIYLIAKKRSGDVD